MNKDDWENRLAIYDELVKTLSVTERKGKGMPYTSANGYMFSMLNNEGEIGIRLPKEVGEDFMKVYNTTSFKSHGAFMRGYVLVPKGLYGESELLTSLLRQGYDYVMSLEPK